MYQYSCCSYGEESILQTIDNQALPHYRHGLVGKPSEAQTTDWARSFGEIKDKLQ
jgi:hypothetical protein